MPINVQPRFWFILAIILIVVIVSGALIANSVSPAKPKPTPTPIPIVTPAVPTPTLVPASVSCTIKAAVGIQSVQITNQNTGATWMFTPIDLPAVFNTKYGDTLTFRIIASSGYKFNYWIFGDNTIQSQNPYTIKLVSSITMDARFLMNTTG